MPRLLLGGSLFLAVLCLAPARAQAPQTPAVEKPSENQTERLAALGKLWGAVKFFHPFLAYRDIDWDGALVTAIPRVKAARTPADYRMAIDGMLEVLGDPATRVEMMSAEPPPARAAPAPPADSTYFHVVDGYVVVDAASLTQAMARGAASPGQVQLQAEIGKATGVVLDCRFANAQPNDGQSFFLNTFLTGLLPMIVEGSASLGTARYRLHNGYPPQQGNSSGATIVIRVDDAECDCRTGEGEEAPGVPRRRRHARDLGDLERSSGGWRGDRAHREGGDQRGRANDADPHA